MKRIPLINRNHPGKFVAVSNRDFKWLSQWEWHYGKQGAIRWEGRTILMAREILGVSDNVLVDHWDCDNLNNRRSNLRSATKSQNCRNRRKTYSRKTTSRYKGVRFSHLCPNRPWNAQISYTREGKKRRVRNLGWFHHETQAAKAYDKAARKYHGEFARTNFP